MLALNSALDPPLVGGGSGSNPSLFIWKYCRMCALEVKQGVCIFGEEGKRLQIPEKIRKTLAILVLEEDTLPKKICTSCCTSLESYSQFKDAVVDAQEKLASIAKSIEKSQEQNLLQLRTQQQFHRSPKRPKVLPSIASSSSNSHVLVPAPSLVAGEINEADLDDPVIDYNDPPSNPPSSVASSDDGNDPANSKPEQECSGSAVAQASVRDEEVQVQVEPTRASCSTASISPPSTSSKKNLGPSINLSSETHPVSLSHRESSVEIVIPSSSLSHRKELVPKQDEDGAYLICGVCTQRMPDKVTLENHHLKVHKTSGEESDPAYGCSVCPRISSSYEAIRQHIYRHRMAGAFKCADCDQSFPTKDQLHVHISSKHNPSGNKAFTCQACGNYYGTIIALKAHQRKKHLTAIEYASDSPEEPESNSIRNYDSSSAAPLPKKKHEVSSRSDNNNSQSSSKISKPKTDVGHSHDLSSRAPVVELKAKSSENETERGYWKCDICEKILQSKHGYDVHIKTHKGRRYPCEHCGASYTQKPSLDHHVRVHHTNLENLFECPQCQKSFKTFRQLGWHKKTHEKPLTDLRCPQCEKKFLNMISFKTHLKLHRGSTKYSCSLCPKSFYTKRKLEEHMNSHTGRRPIGCPAQNCTKKFSCNSNYSKHFKKHHPDLLGPKGKMIPKPKMVADNNNISAQVPAAPKKVMKSKGKTPSKERIDQGGGSGVAFESPSTTEKEQCVHHPLTIPSVNQSGVSKSMEATSSTAPAATTNDSQTQAAVHPLQNLGPGTSRHATGMVSSCANPYNQNVNLTSAPSFSTTASQTSNIPSNPNINNTPSALNVSQSFSASVQTNTSTTQDNATVAHNQNQSNSNYSQTHHHHHQSTSSNPHTSPNSAHSSSTQTQTPLQPHHQLSQLQLTSHPQPQTPSVWQPVIVPSIKPSHHYNTTGSGTSNSNNNNINLISSFEILECPTIVPAHPSESHGHHHHHSPNSNTTTATLVPVSVVIAHQSTTSSHATHGVSHSSSSGGGAHSSSHHHPHAHSHLANIPHYGPSASASASSSSNSHSASISHSNSSSSHSSSASASASSSAHSIPTSSNSCSVNVPHFVPSSQQNEPMELSYKLDSNNFQEMPMELTKVFQRDPLELCVRQEFAHGQPLMDLSSRVVSVTVAGGGSVNSTMTLNGPSSSSGNGNSVNTQSHYSGNGVNNGSGSTTSSGNILSVPYHKSVDLIERELTLNDFTGAFRQPIDLIARSDEHSHDIYSEGNLVDLSLRSSFGQDQSASSLLRELIDLSSRSDTFNGEINLTNKSASHSHSHANSQPQLHHPQGASSSSHHHTPSGSSSSSAHPHSISSKPGCGNNGSSHHSSSHQHHQHHHHHHHHVQNQSHPSSSATVTLQNVIYPDLNF